MKRKALFSALILTVSIALLLSGCNANTNQPSAAQYPLVIKDSYDREVTIPKRPDRIISLAASNTEIVFALGQGSRLVGVTDTCNYPSEAEKIAKVSSYQGPNMEKIIAAKPDLILADSLTGKDVVEQLQAAGLAVLAIRSDNIQHVQQNIQLIGQAIDVESKADQLVTQMKNRLKTVTDKLAALPEKEKVTVFYEVWNDPSLMSVGPNTFLAGIINTAGGISATADAVSDWPEVSLESLISKNPQVVILGHEAQTPQQVLTRANWQTMDAIKQGRVYSINLDIFSRPGPRVVDAVEALAKLLYPSLFGK